MLNTVKKYWEAKVAVFLFVLYSVWFIFIHMFLPHEHFLYEYFGHSYGLIDAWGAIWGILIARKWGGLKSVFGKALTMFSIGLFLQEFGQLAYSYYIFVQHVDVPYPSIGDIGFFGTIPFYILGAYYLAEVAGVNVSMKKFASKLQALLIPAVMLGVGYFLFLRNYEIDMSNPLRVFLDFGYPLGQAIYISIGILTFSLTRNILGGIMRMKILFFIIAFGAQFLADYIFIFFSEHYYAASPIDYLYLVAYFLMTMAILQLKTVFDSLNRSEK